MLTNIFVYTFLKAKKIIILNILFYDFLYCITIYNGHLSTSAHQMTTSIKAGYNVYYMTVNEANNNINSKSYGGD